PLLRHASLEQDADLIEPARELAEHLLSNAPANAQALVDRWFGGREGLLRA
ncbi:MAG: hypothetical protein JNK52_04915, partial [Zoogloeaceae bacterium]|nr:hypothetical protein [Zoogloeaceae bacterium]